MSELEEKLEAILSNPQMMQTIASMAQSMGQETTPSETAVPAGLPDWDLSALQKLGGLANQNNMDPQQQALLQALRPYLSHNRVQKLERAMRAARIARFASVFLNSGGLQLLSGR